jgi:hypothetical protein
MPMALAVQMDNLARLPRSESNSSRHILAKRNGNAAKLAFAPLRPAEKSATSSGVPAFGFSRSRDVFLEPDLNLIRT